MLGFTLNSLIRSLLFILETTGGIWSKYTSAHPELNKKNLLQGAKGLKPFWAQILQGLLFLPAFSCVCVSVCKACRRDTNTYQNKQGFVHREPVAALLNTFLHDRVRSL